MKIYVDGKELAKRPKEVEKILNEANDYLSKKAFEPITIIDIDGYEAEKDAEIKKLKDEILCLTVSPDFNKVDLDLAKQAGDEQKRRADIAERALRLVVRDGCFANSPCGIAKIAGLESGKNHYGCEDCKSKNCENINDTIFDYIKIAAAEIGAEESKNQ